MTENTGFAVEGPEGPVAGTFGYDNATRTVTFTPSSPLEGGSYLVNVSNQRDNLGDVQQAPYSFNFTVGAGSGGSALYLPALLRVASP